MVRARGQKQEVGEEPLDPHFVLTCQSLDPLPTISIHYAAADIVFTLSLCLSVCLSDDGYHSWCDPTAVRTASSCLSS